MNGALLLTRMTITDGKLSALMTVEYFSVFTLEAFG